MKSHSVLIVDDEAGFLDSIKTIFGLEGIKVYCAENVEEALAALHEQSFSLVITDFKMDGINGLEFAGIIKEKLPHLPVYMLTGDDISSEFASSALEAGISRMFSKPLNIATLLNAVRENREP